MSNKIEENKKASNRLLMARSMMMHEQSKAEAAMKKMKEFF